MPAELLDHLQSRWRALGPRRADGLLAAVIAVAAIAAFWLTPLDSANDVTRRPDLVGGLLVLATAVPLAWRRTAPVGALVSSFVASVAVVAAGYAATSVQFTLAFALVSAAAHGTRQGTLRIAGIGVVVALVGLAVAERADAAPVDALTLAAVVVLPLLVGDLLRTERERAAAVRAQLARGEELRGAALETAAAAERVRIAREVHDVVGHHLSAIAVQAHAGRVALAQDPAQTDRSLGTIVEIAAEALTQTGQALSGLRADAGAVPRPDLAALGELLDAARRDGVHVTHRVEGAPRAAPALVEASAFRIVQEALTNVRRHGGDRADVVLRFAADHLALEVANPLPTPAGADPAAGNGILGMRERAALVEGRLEAGAQPDGRWLVAAWLPLENGPVG